MQTACLGTRAALGDDSDTAWNCARAPGTAEQSALTDLPASVDASRARLGRGVAGASHGLSKEAARARRYLGSPGALQHYRMVGTSTGMPPDTQLLRSRAYLRIQMCMCIYAYVRTCVCRYAARSLLFARCTYISYIPEYACVYIRAYAYAYGRHMCMRLLKRVRLCGARVEGFGFRV